LNLIGTTSSTQNDGRHVNIVASDGIFIYFFYNIYYSVIHINYSFVLQTIKHQLEVVGKNRCYMCYSIMSQSKGRNYTQSHSTKVQTKCLACNKYYSLKCFFQKS